ncbi:MAG: type II toxin-antitoxin system RelE/ParE family toxin [Pseudanabaena sp. CAN_BIN31]|nr:type II toxin-antitoxin system RelE/ParE family toxin [Pseudanabaena sp. CAN_BIN31]
MTKEIFVLSGEIKTPPFSSEARREAGFLLRKIQEGESLSMPYSRPMPSIGKNCYELRLGNGEENWRIVYRVDSDTVLILEVFNKKTQKTPKQVIDNCQRRMKRYDEA